MTITATTRFGRAPADTVDRMAMVEVNGLTKRFRIRRPWGDVLLHPGRRQWVIAVDRLTCRVEPGEVFGLLGPNGAGKTTLFKILSTLIVPDGGTARVAGYDLMREARRVRSVLSPVIADPRSLNWRLTARENLRLYADLYGFDRKTSDGAIEELLHLVGLTDTGVRIAATFSSGMKQRLLLARSLIGRPRILLLDEPTRSLDPVTAQRFRVFLREDIVGRQECTVLLATHDTEEALEVCDRMAVMNLGRIIASGTAVELTRGFGEERYRAWIRMPAGLSARSMKALRAARVEGHERDSEGWTVIDMSIDGGRDEAAKVLSDLVNHGASIARFEKVRFSLADLIQRLLERDTGHQHGS